MIHNSSSPLKINPRNSSPGTSPFARTNAMIAAVSGGENTSKSIVGRTGNRSGSRLLARGQIVEASCRMQISSDSSLYTNGQGLIKLADGSGWAIVPYRDDLMTQLKNYHGNDASWLESSNDIVAYEEIGNATIPTERNPSDRSRDGIIWLRVAHPPGVKVLLAKSKSNLNTNNNNESRTKTNEKGGSHDESPSSSHSEVASSVASSFFDSVWSRVSPLKEKNPQNDAPSQNPNFRQQQQAKRQTIPTIPRGMVVPVEPWDVSTSSNVSAHSRLMNIFFALLCPILNIVFRSVSFVYIMAKGGFLSVWGMRFLLMRLIHPKFELDHFGSVYQSDQVWKFIMDHQLTHQ